MFRVTLTNYDSIVENDEKLNVTNDHCCSVISNRIEITYRTMVQLTCVYLLIDSSKSTTRTNCIDLSPLFIPYSRDIYIMRTVFEQYLEGATFDSFFFFY